jgi:hypothetical protein
LELLKGLIVPVVFASFREIFTIQPNRAAYVMRILIVEDETLVALGTQADFETAGHSVVGLAMTLEEAINLAGWCRLDLVLMDIRPAEGNGVELTQAIHTRWLIPRCSPRAIWRTRPGVAVDPLAGIMQVLEDPPQGHLSAARAASIPGDSQ